MDNAPMLTFFVSLSLFISLSTFIDFLFLDLIISSYFCVSLNFLSFSFSRVSSQSVSVSNFEMINT